MRAKKFQPELSVGMSFLLQMKNHNLLCEFSNQIS